MRFLVVAVLMKSCSAKWEYLSDSSINIARSLSHRISSYVGRQRESRMVNDPQEFLVTSNKRSVDIRDISHRAPLFEPQEVSQLPDKIPDIPLFKTPTNGLEEIFRPIYFSKDDHRVKESGIINGIASYLKEHSEDYLYVEGHNDQSTSESYNLSLAHNRAMNVKRAILSHGISENRIFVVSYGKEFPTNDSEESDKWVMNRRVTFKIYKRGSQ